MVQFKNLGSYHGKHIRRMASPDDLCFLQVRHIVPEHFCVSISEALIGHFIQNGLQQFSISQVQSFIHIYVAGHDVTE